MIVVKLTFVLFLKESGVQKALMTSSTSAITCRRGYWLMSLCITCHCQGYKLKGKAYAWFTVCAILLTHGGCYDGWRDAAVLDMVGIASALQLYPLRCSWCVSASMTSNSKHSLMTHCMCVSQGVVAIHDIWKCVMDLCHLVTTLKLWRVCKTT